MSPIKLLLTWFLWLAASHSLSAQEFLEVDQAFKPQVELLAKQQLQVSWDIADGYKLYKTSLTVKAVTPEMALPDLVLPPAKRGFDKGLDKVVETYEHHLTGTLTLPPNATTFKLEINYQGCAVAGLCYPPQTRNFQITPLQLGLQALLKETEDEGEPTIATAISAESPPDILKTGFEPAQQAVSETQDASIQNVLRGGNLLRIGAAFLVFGLLLSLTPCVLPMLPILSSIIVGQNVANRRRSFLLAVSYSLGMALVYTGLGLAAGLIGEGLAAFMQEPWVLCAFALLLAAMALSMFDVFELQMPASWQSRLTQVSGQFEGGQYLTVFVMGALSSLIVGPCVAGPLAGALLYISQTQNIFIGGFALFVMACGMSVPLLLTGLSAGSLLPKAGSWMLHIKSVFGFMLLGVALWMINPLLNAQARLMVWGAWFVLAAFFTPLLSTMHSGEKLGTRVGRALGFLMLLIGTAEFTGGMMGHTDLVAPLNSASSSASNLSAKSHVQFERITGMQALDEVLAGTDRPVVLDFYADWCAACLEMEKFTFTDPQVIAQMQGWRTLQVDVTRNTPEDRALMRRFQVFGPPAMIFFEKTGQEFTGSRVMGYLPADSFIRHLNKLAIQ